MRRIKRWVHCTFFYVLLLHLGAMSLTWCLVSLLLYPLVPRAPGTVLGRAAIADFEFSTRAFEQGFGDEEAKAEAAGNAFAVALGEIGLAEAAEDGA